MGLAHDQPNYLRIANPETEEGFSGHHGPHTLFLFDEATAAPDKYYALAQTQARLIVALANPRTLTGWFRRGFPQYEPNKTQTVRNLGRSRASSPSRAATAATCGKVARLFPIRSRGSGLRPS